MHRALKGLQPRSKEYADLKQNLAVKRNVTDIMTYTKKHLIKYGKEENYFLLPKGSFFTLLFQIENIISPGLDFSRFK